MAERETEAAEDTRTYPQRRGGTLLEECGRRVAQMPGFDKHIVRVAKTMPAAGVEVSAVRGALRGAVHGRGMPVDAVHSGAGTSEFSGLTVLMVAAQRGRADVIKVLLKEFGAGAGAVADSTCARAALELAVSGNHAAAASELRVWLGDETSGDAGEDGEVVDDGEDGEVTEGGTAQGAPRSETTSSAPSVFGRLKMTAAVAGSSGASISSDHNTGAGAGAGRTALSPKWKKDYSELSFAEKLRMLKAPAAPAAGSVAADDSQSRLAEAPQDGWVRFGAVHSQWRDHLDIRSDGTFGRVSRDDGGRWSAARWESAEVGEITIHWANWDVSDTLHTTDGGATFHAVGTNQRGDEYQFKLTATETSSGDGAGGARSTLSLPAWFNPAAPDVQAASGEFRGKARRDRPGKDSAREDTDGGWKRRRQSDGGASMAVPQVSRLKALERGAKFGTLTAEQQAELAELRGGAVGASAVGSDGASSPKKQRPAVAAALPSSLDDDMDEYFKR